jgi:hypothetical protein
MLEENFSDVLTMSLNTNSLTYVKKRMNNMSKIRSDIRYLVRSRLMSFKTSIKISHICKIYNVEDRLVKITKK